jgi:hypothetical protein
MARAVSQQSNVELLGDVRNSWHLVGAKKICIITTFIMWLEPHHFYAASPAAKKMLLLSQIWQSLKKVHKLKLKASHLFPLIFKLKQLYTFSHLVIYEI